MELGRITQLTRDPAPALAKAFIRMTNELERQNKEWKTTPPTEPGWYWAWGNGEPFVMRAFYNDPSDKYVSVAWLSQFGGEPDYWLGPLPVPEPPK